MIKSSPYTRKGDRRGLVTPTFAYPLTPGIPFFTLPKSGFGYKAYVLYFSEIQSS